MADQLNSRNRLILEAIVEGHIDSGEPLGSGTVSRRSRLGLSPATVRNVMAQLEESGHLCSPHASAGRIPTQKAYRYYVDSLLNLESLSDEQRRSIDHSYRQGTRPVEEELRQAGRTLSDISRYAGIVVAPRFSTTVFKQLEFVRLSDHRILVILISDSGMVHKKLIEIEEKVSQRQLDQASGHLNRTLGGLSIAEAKKRIARDVAREKALYKELSRWALDLSREALRDEPVGQVFIEGTANILDQPEFSDLTRMRQLIRVFEQKSLLLELLDRSQKSQAPQVLFPEGRAYLDIQGCSLVTSSYTNSLGIAGSIGILGPMRMPYSRVVPVVDYMARLISGTMASHI